MSVLLSLTNKETTTHRLVQLHELHIRLVPQSVDFSPKHRNASSNLNEAHLDFTFVGAAVGLRSINKENLFRFVEVGHIPVVINTTSEISGSCTVSTSSTDKAELQVVAIEPSWSNVECYNSGSRYG